MKKAILQNRSGFSLVELLIVMGMMGIVMGAIYSLYSAQQRSTYAQSEVVDIQQNLRVALESITRDVRMAGFLIPRSSAPILLASNATGIVQPLPAPNNVGSDAITINTASESETFARMNPPTVSYYSVAGSSFTLAVDSAASVDALIAGNASTGDYVRIVRPTNRDEPKLDAEAQGTGRVYYISAKDRNVPSLTLTIASGSPGPTGVHLYRGDMICKTTSPYPHPNTIRYCLGPAAGCGNTVTTCPTGQLCLMREVNAGASPDVIAQNIAGLQFRYLMDDGTESDVPGLYKNVRAVRVTLIGQTVTAAAMSGGQARQRESASVIQIKNR